jgi:hypothetical protein
VRRYALKAHQLSGTVSEFGAPALATGILLEPATPICTRHRSKPVTTSPQKVIT